ncbi:hypothetical protein QBC37DRAFT_379886 [Rhypophila decipiens]|uniref:Uncharacterized protein n=1 Tax=Rhypophila decipiens TaxID=261697 RepID=A0AAN6XXS1_9PEZI|nr:hypothetical protein QBC37DRAFT_379886 [Rhypophila decipiens]
MARLISFLATLATLLFLGVHVAHASSKSWQSGMKPQDPLPVRRLVLDSRGHADVDANHNDTSARARLQKRVGLIKYNMNGYRKWENHVVRYCFATEESRTVLQDTLHEAVTIWQNALDSEDWRWELVPGAHPGAACTNHPDRASILVIHLANRLSSSVGIPALNQARPDYQGPRMLLTTAETMGSLNRVANIAHEVGHVWGLLHEHQNPWYWARSETHWAPFTIHKPGSFNCENLADYEAGMQRARAAGINPPEKICQDQRDAARAEFTASDYLPYPLGEHYSQADDEDDIDWDSIMLYPSTGGGRGTAGPPIIHPDNPNPDYWENDHRAEVLLGRQRRGAGFERFGANLVPSDEDVDTLQLLYGDEWATFEWAGLINEEEVQEQVQAAMC